MAAPAPNKPKISAPRAAPPSVATSVRAVPNKGPEHGLQIKPNRPPNKNAPFSEAVSSDADAPFAELANGDMSVVRRALSAGTSMVRPKAISMKAANVRTLSGFRPKALPNTPITTPRVANDSVMPSAMASGAARWRCVAPPKTNGSRGKTHGERVVRLPAARLKPHSFQLSMAVRAYSAAPSVLRMASGAVSPICRAFSATPRNTMKVDWLRTLSCFFKVVSLS